MDDTKTFDISDLDVQTYAEEGVEVPIVNPRTNEPTGVVIRVQGAFSSRFRELVARRKRQQALRAKSAVARAVSPSDDDDDTSEVLAEVTLGWENVVEHGKPIPFSKAEARRVFEKYPVIRGQVLAAAIDVGNFIKG